jgi:hypothetical protein
LLEKLSRILAGRLVAFYLAASVHFDPLTDALLGHFQMKHETLVWSASPRCCIKSIFDRQQAMRQVGCGPVVGI